MKKTAKTTIEVRGTLVSILSEKQEDYICLTDIARYKDPERTDYLISNWLRNRNTVEFLGIWEQLYNPDRTQQLHPDGQTLGRKDWSHRPHFKSRRQHPRLAQVSYDEAVGLEFAGIRF